MAESGYHHAQIARIARIAGVADGTVYLYFKNKEDILVSLLRRSIEKIVEKLQASMCSMDGAADKLDYLVHLYLRELGADPKLAMVTQVHMRQVDAGIRRAIGEFMKPLYDVLDGIIEDGVRQGVFRPSMDRRIARRMIFGTIDETVTAWVLTGSKYDLHAQADAVVDVLLNGLKVRPQVHQVR
ncbi:MAG: TetR family transcriptional regulator [Alicyclobacillus herbarius]|nr:TetR family transcriptional regulator [Alicyclobacillus herbarius]